MERLRYVARADGTPQRILVSETADALLDVVDEPAGLVTACRQMVQRQPTSGPLVWLAAHLLSADEPAAVVWDLVAGFDDDPTDRELAHALADGARLVVLGWPEVVTAALGRRGDVTVTSLEGPVVAGRLPLIEPEPLEAPLSGASVALAGADIVVCEALAAGPEAMLTAAGTGPVVAAAAHAGVDVWAVVPHGRALPAPLWRGMVRRLPPASVYAEHEVVDASLVTAAVSPVGRSSLADAIHAGACPPAPELQ